jgi:hypothetical protein
MNGKGDSPRKKSVTEEIWAKNWEKIFGKNNNERDKSKNKNNRSKQ